MWQLWVNRDLWLNNKLLKLYTSIGCQLKGFLHGIVQIVFCKLYWRYTFLFGSLVPLVLGLKTATYKLLSISPVAPPLEPPMPCVVNYRTCVAYIFVTKCCCCVFTANHLLLLMQKAHIVFSLIYAWSVPTHQTAVLYHTTFMFSARFFTQVRNLCVSGFLV